ncbi:suppression of tumorigenicity 5 st5 [Anaeramoeba flamelloides]|uniref:Suppression of tumorigenicity 5 st5 n=1 Tax=Anaeramoeba flamelloides TaxID=1746091 RepID=A0AAV7ZW32_9EUKA|nr:suppression of tumorigenicity 5 st5 [Anaeramoeba flamelloides]
MSISEFRTTTNPIFKYFYSYELKIPIITKGSSYTYQTYENRITLKTVFPRNKKDTSSTNIQPFLFIDLNKLCKENKKKESYFTIALTNDLRRYYCFVRRNFINKNKNCSCDVFVSHYRYVSFFYQALKVVKLLKATKNNSLTKFLTVFSDIVIPKKGRTIKVVIPVSNNHLQQEIVFETNTDSDENSDTTLHFEGKEKEKEKEQEKEKENKNDKKQDKEEEEKKDQNQREKERGIEKEKEKEKDEWTLLEEVDQEGLLIETKRDCQEFMLTNSLIEVENQAYEYLFQKFHFSGILIIILSFFFERRCIFTSSNISLLTNSILAFLNLLLPFNWEYTLILLLNNKLIHLLTAPIPFIIGLPKAINNTEGIELDINEKFLIVDLDNGDLHNPFEDLAHLGNTKFWKFANALQNFQSKINENQKRSEKMMKKKIFNNLQKNENLILGINDITNKFYFEIFKDYEKCFHLNLMNFRFDFDFQQFQNIGPKTLVKFFENFQKSQMLSNFIYKKSEKFFFYSKKSTEGKFELLFCDSLNQTIKSNQRLKVTMDKMQSTQEFITNVSKVTISKIILQEKVTNLNVNSAIKNINGFYKDGIIKLKKLIKAQNQKQLQIESKLEKLEGEKSISVMLTEKENEMKNENVNKKKENEKEMQNEKEKEKENENANKKKENEKEMQNEKEKEKKMKNEKEKENENKKEEKEMGEEKEKEKERKVGEKREERYIGSNEKLEESGENSKEVETEKIKKNQKERSAVIKGGRGAKIVKGKELEREEELTELERVKIKEKQIKQGAKILQNLKIIWKNECQYFHYLKIIEGEFFTEILEGLILNDHDLSVLFGKFPTILAFQNKICNTLFNRICNWKQSDLLSSFFLEIVK